jgi:hypothetical protein
MEEREGDLTSKHATGCHSLTKNNERLDWKDEHKAACMCWPSGFMSKPLRNQLFVLKEKGMKRKTRRKQQQVLASYHPVFGLPSIHYPLFAWGPQNKEILLNLGMKSWVYSVFNAQGSRVIMVVVQVTAVKIM